MLPVLIESLLSLGAESDNPACSQGMNQIIVTNFPALRTLKFAISPPASIFRQIYYQINFGEAMIPHAFDVKMVQAGNKLFDAIVSGVFISRSFDLFVISKPQNPIELTATNLRAVDNYYEVTIEYLDVKPGESWKRVQNYLKAHNYQATVR